LREHAADPQQPHADDDPAERAVIALEWLAGEAGDPQAHHHGGADGLQHDGARQEGDLRDARSDRNCARRAGRRRELLLETRHERGHSGWLTRLGLFVRGRTILGKQPDGRTNHGIPSSTPSHALIVTPAGLTTYELLVNVKIMSRAGGPLCATSHWGEILLETVECVTAIALLGGRRPVGRRRRRLPRTGERDAHGRGGRKGDGPQVL